MNSTLYRGTMAGVVLMMLLFSTPLGQVKTGYAQAQAGWSPAINLSNSGASADPSIVVDSTGVIHVTWVDTVDGYKYVKSTDALSWSKPITVDFPFDPEKDLRPRMIADSAGSIHIFWIRPDDATDEDEANQLFYARTSSIFLSQPLSWSTVEVVAESVLDFDVFADTRNIIHLSYVGSSATDNDPAGIFYRRLDDLAWGPPVRLYSSQYFRTLTPADSHIRLAVAGGGRSGEVYAVWDDRPAKRILMAKSPDGGVNWEKTLELRGPEDVTGLALPYNVNVSTAGKNVLLTWQLGQPDSLCSQYGQWSTDGAQSFSDPIRVSDELNTCPTSGVFVGRPPGYFLMVLDLLGDLSLVAWNGAEWSSLQPQAELNAFANPLTLDDVVLGCRQFAQRADMLYVVGCEQTGNGDIWFRSQKIGALEDWFPLPSTWAGPHEISSITQEMSSSAALADDSGRLHTMWIQYSSGDNEAVTATVQYSSWHDGEWSRPTNIITGLDGVPQQLTAASDGQGGILLAWVQGAYGDIYFSRAPGEKAYLASEWSSALRVPSLSELNAAPDILADSSSRIVLAYSIPYNENRGIYFIQSDDLGRTWSQPFRIFDAVAMDWDSVTAPKLELSEGGRLHLLITRSSLREGTEQASLYYLQSDDGGATWTTPEAVSEQNAEWSEIVYVGNNTLHRIWQERSRESIDVFSEVSSDGGSTWSSALKVSTGEGRHTALVPNTDADGQLYLLQSYLTETNIALQEVSWDGSRWSTQQAGSVALEQTLDRYFISSGIASDRVLHLILSIDYEGSSGSIDNKILGFSRALEPSNGQPVRAVLLIPSPAQPAAAGLTLPPDQGGIPTPVSPLAGVQEESNVRLRNRIGLALVAGIVILALLILRPARKKQ